MLGLDRDDMARRAAVRFGLRADAGAVRSVVPAPEPHDCEIGYGSKRQEAACGTFARTTD